MGDELEPVEQVDEREASVSYVVGDCWRVTVTAQHGTPWDGPQSLTVVFVGDSSKDVDSADETNGISTAVLRAIPLADARVRLRRLRADARVSPELVEVVQQRCAEPVDWARFAQAYAEVAKGSRQPLATMAEASGVNRRTLAARATKARELGYLTTPSEESLGDLTTAAKRLLRRTRAQWTKASRSTPEREEAE